MSLENVAIESIISNTIISFKKDGKPITVAICGAADLGKSYLSGKIVEGLQKQKLSANHFTLDSYLLDRNLRIERGISGYEIEAYDVHQASNDLLDLVTSNTVQMYPYNHKKVRKVNTLSR